MSTINPRIGRLVALVGGVLLIVSLFLPWMDFGGETRNGWEVSTTLDVFMLLTGLCGIVAGLTGGRRGFFRPDLSFNAMTDIFGVMLMVLIAWLLLFDFPHGADREAGVYVGLVAAAVVATGAGDFRVSPATLFPAGAQTKGPER